MTDNELTLLETERPVHLRMLALHALGKDERKTPERVAKLREVLAKDPDPIIRHDAAFVLGAMMAEEAADALVSAAIHDESFLVRHESLESLAFFAPTEAIRDAIERGKSDPHIDVRETATMAEMHHRTRSSADAGEVDAATLLDQSRDIHVRWAGAFALLDDHAAGRAPDAGALLARALRSDPSSFVRHTAAFMLEEVGGVEARELLASVAGNDPSVLVRHEAIETLGFMPFDDATEKLLESLLSDADDAVVRTAQIALDIQRERSAADSPTVVQAAVTGA